MGVKIGCALAARISPGEQLERYIFWLKEHNLDGRRRKVTHLHVYPPKTKALKTTQARLRSEGFKLLEV